MSKNFIARGTRLARYLLLPGLLLALSTNNSLAQETAATDAETRKALLQRLNDLELRRPWKVTPDHYQSCRKCDQIYRAWRSRAYNPAWAQPATTRPCAPLYGAGHRHRHCAGQNICDFRSV